MSEMVTWHRERYLDPGVWNQIQSKINPDGLPSNITTLQLPPPPRTAASPMEIMYMVKLEICISAEFKDVQYFVLHANEYLTKLRSGYQYIL